MPLVCQPYRPALQRLAHYDHKIAAWHGALRKLRNAWTRLHESHSLGPLGGADMLQRFHGVVQQFAEQGIGDGAVAIAIGRRTIGRIMRLETAGRGKSRYSDYDRDGEVG